ncbi:MAG: PilN domain-containing protein [Rubrobacter sp.]
MRRINLLPQEERRRLAGGFRGAAFGILLIVGAGVLVLGVGAYLVLLGRLGTLEARIAELDTDIARRNGHLAELSPYRDLQVRLDEKKPVADGIYRSRFAWDEFLQGLAFVVPETTALQTLTAEAAPVDVEAPVEQPLDPPGAVTFTGVALPRYQNVADFVVRMDNLEFLANSQLNSAELNRETFVEPAIDFEVASELVTVVGETGAEVRLEGGSQDEVAGGAQQRIHPEELAGKVRVAAEEQYADRTVP